MSPNSTIRLTTAQAILRYLARQHSVRDGVTRRLVPGVLGIFGHGNTGGIGQALDDYRDDFFFIEGRNEQGIGHIAAGYAKVMRREATLACTSSIGPGSTNMITAAAGAHINRLPILLFPADTYMARRQGPILQGLENPVGADVTVNDCFRPVSRFFDRIVRPEQIIDTLPRAMRALTDPVECGPVVLALPQDVQVETFDFPAGLFEEHQWLIERPKPDDSVVAAAARLLAAAERPLIVAGGGVAYSRAEAELLAFAEEHSIPIGETFAGRSTVPPEHPLALGGLGFTGSTAATAAAREADVVVAAGTRLSDVLTGSKSMFQNPGVRFVGLNINGTDASKFGAQPVTGDLRESLGALTEAMRGQDAPDRSDYTAHIGSLKDAWNFVRVKATQPAESPPLRQSELIDVLNRDTRAGDVVVAAAGTLPGDLFAFWDGEFGADCHLEFGYSCMGYEIAGAVGARLAGAPGHVVALVGDATLLLSSSEIAVAAQHGLDITVIVSDNSGMRSIVGLEGRILARPYANVFDHRDPDTLQLGGEIDFDLPKMGEALRAKTFAVGTREELADALADARQHDGPCMIVARTDNSRSSTESTVWWDIPAAPSSEHTDMTELRQAYERGHADQRHHL